MDYTNIENSIAYCGLICKLCFLREKCDGCKTLSTQCRHDHSDQGCYNKQCSQEKRLDGCWECSELETCHNGIFEAGDYSKIKAFSLYIQGNGKKHFIQKIMANETKGLSVEKGKDYDHKHISEVFRMIETGK
jgi:hypothetical protein